MGNDGNETPFVPTVPIVSIVSFVPIVSTVPTVRNVPFVLFVPTVRNVPTVPNVPFVPYRKNVPVVPFVSGVPGPLRHGAEAPRHLPRTRGRQPSPSQSARASCATSPARGRGSPLRHSPLARPVPPLPHAGEANVTYRSCLPRLRGRWPAGPERATFTGLRSKNRAPQPWPAGPERAHVYGTAQQKQGTATVARRAGEGSCLRAPVRRA